MGHGRPAELVIRTFDRPVMQAPHHVDIAEEKRLTGWTIGPRRRYHGSTQFVAIGQVNKPPSRPGGRCALEGALYSAQSHWVQGIQRLDPSKDFVRARSISLRRFATTIGASCDPLELLGIDHRVEEVDHQADHNRYQHIRSHALVPGKTQLARPGSSKRIRIARIMILSDALSHPTRRPEARLGALTPAQ